MKPTAAVLALAMAGTCAIAQKEHQIWGKFDYYGCVSTDCSQLQVVPVTPAGILTPESCQAACIGHAFAYAFYDVCRCGDVAPEVVVVDESKCDNPCQNSWDNGACGHYNGDGSSYYGSMYTKCGNGLVPVVVPGPVAPGPAVGQPVNGPVTVVPGAQGATPSTTITITSTGPGPAPSGAGGDVGVGIGIPAASQQVPGIPPITGSPLVTGTPQAPGVPQGLLPVTTVTVTVTVRLGAATPGTAAGGTGIPFPSGAAQGPTTVVEAPCEPASTGPAVAIALSTSISALQWPSPSPAGATVQAQTLSWPPFSATLVTGPSPVAPLPSNAYGDSDGTVVTVPGTPGKIGTPNNWSNINGTRVPFPAPSGTMPGGGSSNSSGGEGDSLSSLGQRPIATKMDSAASTGFRKMEVLTALSAIVVALSFV